MINQKNLIFILTGIISGFFVGLIGIGSGVIAIPGLTMAGLNIKQAITTGLFLQAVPQTLPGFWLYKEKGHFEFEPTMMVLLGSLVGITIGSLVHYYNYLTDKSSYVILSLLLFMTGFHVFYRNVWNTPLEKEVKKKVN